MCIVVLTDAAVVKKYFSGPVYMFPPIDREDVLLDQVLATLSKDMALPGKIRTSAQQVGHPTQ